MFMRRSLAQTDRRARKHSGSDDVGVVTLAEANARSACGWAGEPVVELSDAGSGLLT